MFNSYSGSIEMLIIVSTKGFRRQRGKFQLIMRRDTLADLEALKNLLTCLSRFVFKFHFMFQ